MATLKALNHKYCLSLGTCHNAVQFTDPNPTIYWYEKRGKLNLKHTSLQSNKSNVRVSDRV